MLVLTIFLCANATTSRLGITVQDFIADKIVKRLDVKQISSYKKLQAEKKLVVSELIFLSCIILCPFKGHDLVSYLVVIKDLNKYVYQIL